MKVIECDDEKKLVHFFDKKMAAEVDGSALGEGDHDGAEVRACDLRGEEGSGSG